MSVIIRLQGLSWSASAMDIRNFFKGLNIPPGGVHIIGGERGDAFIAFSTDEDARRAMLLNNGKLNDMPVMLFLSSKTEMQNTIIEAKERSTAVSAPTPSTQQPIAAPNTSTPAIMNPMSHQLPVIPGLGIQPQLPQINQLSQFLSGLLPNSELTSSVVNKLMNQHQQHTGQAKNKMANTDLSSSSFKTSQEHALPGEYSVGGIPQLNYVKQHGEHGNREMSPFGIDSQNGQPPHFPSYNLPLHGHLNIGNNEAISSTSGQQFSMSDTRQSWTTSRNETQGRPYEHKNVIAGAVQALPPQPRWATPQLAGTDATWNMPSGNPHNQTIDPQNKQLSNRNTHGQTFDKPNKEVKKDGTLINQSSSGPVSTNTMDSMSLKSINVPVSKNDKGDALPPQQKENVAKLQNPSNAENKLPIDFDDNEETEIDEFGRTVRKRPNASRSGDSPTNRRDKRDSRERSRDQDRLRRHDSPRRDRDRRDRDRRDRRDRDRDRDRRYRDRDDDNRRERYRDQDRKNSPASSDSIRRSKKRSLSPSNTNAKDTDKKLQIDKQENLEPDQTQPNTDKMQQLVPPVLNKVSGPTPLFPVIPPRGSGQGILGAAPPNFLNSGAPLSEANKHLQGPGFIKEKGETMSLGHHIDEMGQHEIIGHVPMEYIGPHDERLLATHLQHIQGPPGFERAQTIGGPLIESYGLPEFNQGPSNVRGAPERHRLLEDNHVSPDDNQGPPNRRPLLEENRGGPDFRQELPERRPLIEENRGRPDFNQGAPERRPFLEENHRHLDFNQGPLERRPLLEHPDFNLGPPERRPFLVDNLGRPEFNQGPPERRPLLDENRARPDFNQGPPERRPLLEENRGHPDFNQGPPERRLLLEENRAHPDFNQGPPERRHLFEDNHGRPEFNQAPPIRPLLEENRDRPDFNQGLPERKPLLEENRGRPDFNQGLPERRPLLEDNRGHPDFNQGPPERRPLLVDNLGRPEFNQGPPERRALLEENHGRPDFNQGPPERRPLLEENRGRPDFNQGPPEGRPLLEENRGRPDFNQGLPERRPLLEENRARLDFNHGLPERRPLLEENRGHPDFNQGPPERRLLEENRGHPDFNQGPHVRGPLIENDHGRSEFNQGPPHRVHLLENPPGLRMNFENNRPNPLIAGRYQEAPPLLGAPPEDNRPPWEKDNQLRMLEEPGRDPPRELRGPADIERRKFEFKVPHEGSDFRTVPFTDGFGVGGVPPDAHLHGGRPPFEAEIRPLLDPREMPYAPDRPDMIVPPRQPVEEFDGRSRVTEFRRRPLLEDPVTHEMQPEFMDVPPRSHADIHNRPPEHRPDRQRFPQGRHTELLGSTCQDRDQNSRRRPLLGNNDIRERDLPERRDFKRNSDMRNRSNPDLERHEGRDGRQSDSVRDTHSQELQRGRESNRDRVRDRESNRDRDNRDRRERESRRDSRRDEDSRRQRKSEASDKSDRDRKSEKIEPRVRKDDSVKGDFFVRMNNIPLEFNHGDIAKLYTECAIAKKGIKVINDSAGNRTGKAYVQFCNADSHALALKLSGSVVDKRIIAVNEVSRKEFSDAVDSYEPNSDEGETDRERSKKIDLCNTLTATLMNLKGENANLTLPKQEKERGSISELKSKEGERKSNDNQTKTTVDSIDFVVVVGELSGKASTNDIRNLFKDCEIAEKGNPIILGEVIKGLRQCFVEFINDKSLKCALRARRVVLGNKITINKSSKTEMDLFAKQLDRLRDPSMNVKVDRDTKLDKRIDMSDSDKNEPSVDKDYHCIRITNLPFDFHHHDFRRLLEGLNIAPRGIQVCHDALGRTLGEGCVELVDHGEARKASEKDGLVMGRNRIRVEMITKQTLIDHMRHARQALRPELASQPQVFYFVKAENLPANISTGEIINFFNGYHSSPESIRLNVGDKDESPDSSTALVGFRQREDAERAVGELNNCVVRNRRISLDKVIL